METNFSQIETLALSDRIVNLLQEAIMKGSIRPNERINTDKLARQFKVSHIPIREALKKLETLGLVRMEANKSARVVELTPEDFEHIHAVRISLEGLAVSLAAGHMSATGRKRLQAAVTAMRVAVREKDLGGLVAADKHFHEVIWDLTGNPFLIKSLSHLLLPYFGILVSKASYSHLKNLSDVPRTHQELLDALSREDASQAKAILMGMHSRLVRWYKSAEPRPRRRTNAVPRAAGASEGGKAMKRVQA